MVFGAAAYSEYAFSDFPDSPLDSDAFDEFLAEVQAERCWLVELDALSLASSSAYSAAFSAAAFSQVGFSDASAGVTGGVTTLRFSSHGYTSHANDSPASTHYEARVTADNILIERRVVGRADIAGLARVVGEVSLNNADGGLDALNRDYAVDGRRIRLLLGRPDDALADYGLVFSGVVSMRPTIGREQVRITLSDGIAKLELPANDTVYAGSGSVEGADDLQGKAKPVGLGEALNILAVPVDTTNLIYQVNDGAISDVPVVYDRGVVLTQGADYSSQVDMTSNAPSAGQYRVWKGGGFFRLGSTPAGTVTADMLGDASLSGYVDSTADIVLRLLVVRSGLTSSEIDPASFSRLGTDAGADVGIWTGTDARMVAELVDELLAGVGAFGGFSRHGSFTVGVLKDPSSQTPMLTLTELEILDIEEVALPAPVEPAVWRWRVGWQRNYTLQTDFAASVTAARRAFAAQAMRFATSESSTVQSQRLLAKEYLQAGLYQDEADADTEADRAFALWNGRRCFRVTTPPIGFTADIGRVVQLEHARYGLALGVPGLILAHSVRGNTAELLALT